jgi:glycosyltransferase involved in cell wall biosynthesis
VPHPIAATDTRSPHHRPYFLFVGRLERIKGLDDVIPLFAHYDAADLIVIGDGTHRAALERLAAGNPRVHFLGALPQEALARYYAHAVAAVVPTVGFETFGFVVIEAFRHGTPALVRRIGPLPELIDASGGGETFETPAELVSAMRRLQEDEAGRARLARAAYEGFLANWTESVVVPRYLALLDRVARARGQTRLVRLLEEGRAA